MYCESDSTGRNYVRLWKSNPFLARYLTTSSSSQSPFANTGLFEELKTSRDKVVADELDRLALEGDDEPNDDALDELGLETASVTTSKSCDKKMKALRALLPESVG